MSTGASRRCAASGSTGWSSAARRPAPPALTALRQRRQRLRVHVRLRPVRPQRRPPTIAKRPPPARVLAGTGVRARKPGSGREYNGHMEGSMAETSARSWLRCYRCWSQDLEVQVHYEGIHKIDPDTGERAEVVDELQEAVVQCLDCMHDQPHLGFNNGRVEPIEDRWERMIAGTPWVASCTVTVDADDVESCSGPGGRRRALIRRLRRPRRARVLHPRALPQARGRRAHHRAPAGRALRPSLEEATEVLESVRRGALTITSLAPRSHARRRQSAQRPTGSPDGCPPRRSCAPVLTGACARQASGACTDRVRACTDPCSEGVAEVRRAERRAPAAAARRRSRSARGSIPTRRSHASRSTVR